jgi:hypothetical protein
MTEEDMSELDDEMMEKRRRMQEEATALLADPKVHTPTEPGDADPTG